MAERILYEFPHSHFCEKARWALDHKGLDYRRVPLLPPWHGLVTRRYGKRTSVPVLLDGRQHIQGSAEIITYLDSGYSGNQLTPGDPADLRKREKSYDYDIGVPIRAFLYFYSLRYKKFISEAFMQNSPEWQRQIFRLQYPVLAALIRRSYCPDKAAADAAGKKLIESMDRVQQELDGRKYLLAEGFSRLDIAVCSLLSFIARPREFPMRWPDIPEDEFLRDWDQRLRSHPLIDWVQDVYRQHRGPAVALADKTRVVAP